MDPTIGDSLNAANAVVDICIRLKKFFSDFRPETQSVAINFADHTCEISFRINIPDGWRKKQRKIVVPAHESFAITRMFDSAFNQHRHEWKRIGSEYVLDASKLPYSETYLVTMEGQVSKDALNQLVYIKPAANPVTNENVDNYWLESGLRSLKMLEGIYTDLEIDDVNFGVDVSIDKIFGLTIPPEIKAQAESVGRVIRAASHMDRQEWYRAMQNYRAQTRILPDYDVSSFTRLINWLTSREVIEKYVSVDRPYGLGTVQPPEHYHGVVPQSMKISATTELTLRNPTAKGYLKFNKKGYIEKLRSEFKLSK